MRRRHAPTRRETLLRPTAVRRFFFGRGRRADAGDRGLGAAGAARPSAAAGPADLARRARDLGRWLVAVQHASGSLEAAVASVRRRNLGISFGVLLLLSVSVGAAGPGLAARAAAGASADGVRRRRLARAAHADRRHPLGRREPVARRRRQHRPREAVRHGDGGRGAASRRDGRERAAVRRRRVGARPGSARAAGARRPDRSRGRRIGTPRARRRRARGRARRSPPTFRPSSATPAR